MNGLKKFQEFALNADEQKSVKGGLRSDRVWKCTLFISGSSSTDSQAISGDQNAINYCNSVSNCAGCYVVGQ